MFGWFKSKPQQAAVEDDAPPGENEKVLQIKHLCWMAGMSGESIKGITEADLENEHLKYEYDRFWKLQYEALDLARGITDEFYRDAALHQLIDSYMKAGYEGEAKKLYQVLTIDIIQESVLKDHPRLAAKF